MEMKIKHLEFIQGIINRLANNSFLIKGWCITIVAALAALSSSGANQRFILIAYFPIFVFWLLDSYYLWQERLYRGHYDEVRLKNDNNIDFSMKLSTENQKKNQYTDSVFSWTITPFYFVLMATVIILMITI
jgi:hypothetical protein